MKPLLFASPFQDPNSPEAVCVVEDMTKPHDKVNGGGAKELHEETRRLYGSKRKDSSLGLQDWLEPS